MSETLQAPAPEEVDFPLLPLPPGAIPDAFAKSADPQSAPPQRMMAARGMAPIPPKALVPIIYQLMMDPDPKIAAAAKKTFSNLDEKLVAPVLGDNLAPQLLDALARSLGRTEAKFGSAEKLLLNKATPDTAFVWLAQHTEAHNVINVVVENQERLLRCHDIVRNLKKNERVLRSDLDRAVDFLVREGVFLEDVSEFEDSFLRLGKADMLAVLKKVEITEDHLTQAERKKAAELGMSAQQFIESGQEMSDEMRQAILDELDEEEAEVEAKPFHELPIPIQIKRGLSGGHTDALLALASRNRVVAVAGIRNPRITDEDIHRLSRIKTMHEDVIREICHNGEWTKAYAVKLNLVQNPKTPTTLVMRWLPLMRGTDLKTLAKSKQIPSQVAQQAKRLLDRSG